MNLYLACHTLSGPVHYMGQCVAGHLPVERLQIQILGRINQRENEGLGSPYVFPDFLLLTLYVPPGSTQISYEVGKFASIPSY